MFSEGCRRYHFQIWAEREELLVEFFVWDDIKTQYAFFLIDGLLGGVDWLGYDIGKSIRRCLEDDMFQLLVCWNGYAYDVVEIVFEVNLFIPLEWDAFRLFEIQDSVKCQVGYFADIFS